jgi:hypothetical protein
VKSRGLRRADPVIKVREARNAYRISEEKSLFKRPLGTPRRRLKSDIEIDLRIVSFRFRPRRLVTVVQRFGKH